MGAGAIPDMIQVKRKGTRVEREIASFFDGISFVRSARIPGSGAFDGLPGDLRIEIHNGSRWVKWGGESKARKDGFKTLDRWLGEMDVLFLKPDHHVPRMYAQLPVIEEMLEAAYDAGFAAGHAEATHEMEAADD